MFKPAVVPVLIAFPNKEKVGGNSISVAVDTAPTFAASSKEFCKDLAFLSAVSGAKNLLNASAPNSVVPYKGIPATILPPKVFTLFINFVGAANFANSATKSETSVRENPFLFT